MLWWSEQWYNLEAFSQWKEFTSYKFASLAIRPYGHLIFEVKPFNGISFHLPRQHHYTLTTAPPASLARSSRRPLTHEPAPHKHHIDHHAETNLGEPSLLQAESRNLSHSLDRPPILEVWRPCAYRDRFEKHIGFPLAIEVHDGIRFYRIGIRDPGEGRENLDCKIENIEDRKNFTVWTEPENGGDGFEQSVVGGGD